MKLIGAGLLLAAGYLAGIWILKPSKEHIALLQEGSFLFRLIETGIRHRKVPLPELFGQISEKTDSLWHLFFSEMKEKLEEGSDTELRALFKQVLEKYMGEKLTKEELILFLQFGEGILTGDMQFQRSNINQISLELEKTVAALKEQFTGRSRVVRIFCLSVSILIVIILI